MKWNEIPEGTSFAMSQKGVAELRAGKPKAFGAGVICGAVLVIALQSCGGPDDNKTTDKPGDGASVSTTHKPGN